MKTFKYIFLFFSCLCSSMAGYEWPLKKVQLSQGFGEFLTAGVPFVGLEMISSETAVVPYSDGEIIFTTDTQSILGKNYKNETSTMIIHHNDEIRSIYENVTPIISDQYKVAVGRPFASRNTGKRLNFYLNDRSRNRFLNPLVTLPRLNDNRAPVIVSLVLEDENGNTIDVKKNTNVPPGKYAVSLLSYDTVRFPDVFRRTTPQRININYEGLNSVLVDYDTLYSSNGEYQIAIHSPVSYLSLLKAPNVYRLGDYTFTAGIISYQVRITDYSNYANSRFFNFRVR